MKLLIIAAVIVTSLPGSANAAWTKVLSCTSGAGTLVVDQDSDSPERMQVVVIGRDAVNVIEYGIQGNSESMPQYLHLYDGGNKLVISDLTTSESLNPSRYDPYRIQVVEAQDNVALLKYPSGSEIEPQANYRFYNCSR